jgi:simple sugar transport system permease protein
MRDFIARLAGRVELYLLAAILLLGGLLSIATDSFFTIRNLFDLLTSYATVGVLAAGLLVVLISGAIDISFTATASVAQYVMMSYLIARDGNWLIAFCISAAVGAALGAANAALVHFLRVSSIIVTIATLNIFYGFLIFITNGEYLYAIPDWFQAGITWFQIDDRVGNAYDVSLPIVVLVGSFLLTWALLDRTSLGRKIYALGSNPEGASRLGFSIFGLRLFAFCYMGALAGVAGLLQGQIARQIDPTALVGRELDVLAAVVLGGASLTGGVGTVGGTVLGIGLLAILQNGLILVGVSSYWSEAFVGMVILAAVSANTVKNRFSSGQGARLV